MTTAESEEEDFNLNFKTQKILLEFLKTQKEEKQKFEEIRELRGNIDITAFKEDWQLSQFWYSQNTIEILSEEVLAQTTNITTTSTETTIGCIACPSLYCHLRTKVQNAYLFEFDTRFNVFQDKFIHYDYSFPLHLDTTLKHSFDFLIVDPPFLAEECFEKTCETVKFLLKDGGKILYCTGKVMTDLLEERLSCRPTTFNPEHHNGLANEFGSFVNYQGSTLG